MSGPEAKASATGVESDNDDDTERVRFGWDEEEEELPKELLALWQRAQSGEQRIEIRKLLEAFPRLAHIPARAAENNLLPDYRKKQDAFLKQVSQNVLNALRLMSYQWLRPVDQAVQLQLWQYLAELHFKVSAERRELAVPGIGRLQHVFGEVLFTEEDVKQRRMESNLQNLQRTSVMHTAKVFTLGVSFSQK